ncbi:MAG: hypothetical protein GX442_15885 [Candidatus Riflebacteria bacterium]|nr:hypothetical protein [Candidatus Riflebacteria bacterium]
MTDLFIALGLVFLATLADVVFDIGPFRLPVQSKIKRCAAVAHFCLGLLAALGSVMFVLPSIKEKVFVSLPKTDPARAQAIVADPLFRYLEVWLAVSDFIISWWFVVFPAVAILLTVAHKIITRVFPPDEASLAAGGRLSGISPFYLLPAFENALFGLCGVFLVSSLVLLASSTWLIVSHL